MKLFIFLIRHCLTLAAITSAPFLSKGQAGGSLPLPPIEQSVPEFITLKTLPKPPSQDQAWFVCGGEVLPEYPGGMKAWENFLKKNLRYPLKARSKQIQNRVILSFVVAKDGEIKNVKVLRGLGYGTDEEAIRLMKKSPKWKPGIINGKPVDAAYTMPIFFRIEPN